MRKDGQDNRLFAKAVTLFIMMVLAAGILMHLAWCSYEEKMEILYVVMEQQGEGAELIDIVTGLLKGQIMTEVSGAEQNLAQYGFHENFLNEYKKCLYDSWTVIIVIFCLLYVGFLALLYWSGIRQKLARKNELLWLQEQVTALRDIASERFSHNRGNAGANAAIGAGGDRSAADQTHDKNDRSVTFETQEKRLYGGRFQSRQNLCGEWIDGQQNVLEEYDEDLGRLLLEFSTLADSIALFRRQAESEREETKVLVTDISHQLKTPVAALKTSFEILQSGDLSEAEYEEFLGRCSVQILRLEELVSALVNISRMETGMIELKKTEGKLFDTLLLAVNRIYPRAEEAGIAIELEADEELRQIRVFHDPKWLCEAFLNVLENAVKYSAGQTKIVIRMIKMTVYLRVEIEDEGIGIPRSEWNRIFQRFYRGESKAVQAESGSGVGLYLAREIVARHEGTLVVSAPHHKKQGSCFVFQLPYLTSEMQ